MKLKRHRKTKSWKGGIGVGVFVAVCVSVLVAFGPLSRSVSGISMAWLIAEGVSYITGALFYSINKRRFMHTVFHFFVLLGSLCHILAVWDILVTYL